MNRSIVFICTVFLLFVISCEESEKTPQVQNPPEIDFFSANSLTLHKGDVLLLSWSVRNCDTVSIDHNIGSVASSGSRELIATDYGKTTYTLTALNSVGSVNASVSVTVNVSITQVWENHYQYTDGAGLSGPSPEKMIILSNGGYALIGSVYNMISGASDPIMVRFDNQGQLLRENFFNGDHKNHGYSLAETEDYGFFIVGTRHDSSNEEHPNAFHLFRTDGRGRMTWQKDLYGNREGANDCVVSDDGNYIITGSAYGDSGDTNESKVYLGKFRENTPIWEKTYTMEDLENCSIVGNKVIKTLDGGYAVLAELYQKITNSYWEYKIYLIKTDKNGNLVWENIIEDSGGNNISKTEKLGDFEKTGVYGNSIIRTDDGGFVIAGTSYANDSESAYIVRVDSSGNIVWENRLANEQKVNIRSVIGCSDGSFLLIGDSVSDSFNEIYLARINSSGGLIWQNDYSPDHNKNRWGIWVVETGGNEYVVLAEEQTLPSPHYATNVWLFKIKITE